MKVSKEVWKAPKSTMKSSVTTPLAISEDSAEEHDSPVKGSRSDVNFSKFVLLFKDIEVRKLSTVISESKDGGKSSKHNNQKKPS